MITSQTEFEEFLIDLLLVGTTQQFASGDLNIDLLEATSVGQILENLFAWSDMTLKTSKTTKRLNLNSHCSWLDVIFSNCGIGKIGIVSSTVSDHKFVYAVTADESVKHNAKIRD